MKNYKKIPFSQITDISSYVEEKLKAGHVIIQILVNETHKEIDELISYANDKECESYYRSLTDSDEQLKTCVISEYMEVYYAFKDKNRMYNYPYKDKTKREACTCDIDIGSDRQDVIDFYTFKNDFKDMEKYFDEHSFQYEDYEGKTHYEFYISTGKGDIGNFGGCMEIEFATEWMTEQGYYYEQM